MTLANNGLANAVAYRFTYADASARSAASGFASTDVGSLARQLDDNSLWLLTDDSPATWAQVGGTSSALTVEEVDGSPTDSAVTKIVFPNGTLSIASHVATYTPATAGTYPKFAANKNGTDQTGIATNAWTKVTFGTEEYDTNNNYASSAFTPTVAGKYAIGATLLVSIPGGSNVTCIVAIYKNGTKIKEGRSFVPSPSVGAEYPTVQAHLDANGTTDTFEVYVWHNAGGGNTASVGGDVTQTYCHGALLP